MTILTPKAYTTTLSIKIAIIAMTAITATNTTIITRNITFTVDELCFSTID